MLRICKEEYGRVLFICCPQLLLQMKNSAEYPKDLTSLPHDKYFLYQLDICNDVNMNPHIINLIKGAKHTFDYSEVNLGYYPRDMQEKVSYLPPPVVAVSEELCEKKYDILFCGYTNARTKQILRELIEAGYKVLHVTDFFGPALTRFIQESRIFLNIHDNERKTLDTCRINEAVMASDTYIISEKGTNASDKLYEDRLFLLKRKIL